MQFFQLTSSKNNNYLYKNELQTKIDYNLQLYLIAHK